MSRNSSCLSVTNSVIGVLFAAASVTGKFIFLKKFSDNFTQNFFDIISDSFFMYRNCNELIPYFW